MSSSFKVAVVAKDEASGTLAAINARLTAINATAARARAPYDRLAQSAGKFAKLTGLDRIASGMGGVARSGMQAFQSVARIVEPLAAISGAASVAGMMQLATAWAQFGTNLGNTAARAGLTASQMGALQGAALLAGVSAEAMSGGMTSLRDNMVDFAGGRAAPQVVQAMKVLGLGFDDAQRFAANTTKALPELADKIAALRDPTLQAKVATMLFGGAGEALLPILRQGSAGIAEYTERARKHGLINDEGVAAANRLRTAQIDLTMAVSGLGNAVAQRLEPVLTPLLGQMADWIDRNRDWIATGIGEKVDAFVGYLKGVDWQAIGRDIAGIAHAAGDVAEALGGWKVAAELVLGFFAVSWLAKMLVPFVVITRLLRGLPAEAVAATRGATTSLGSIRATGLAAGALGAGLMATPFALGAVSHGMTLDPAKLAADAERDRTDPGWRNRPDTPEADRRDLSPLGQRFFGSSQATPPPNGVPPTGPLFGPQQRPGTGGMAMPPIDPNVPYDGGAGASRPMRNNNPGDLEFHNQPGAVPEPGSGRFARFSTMEQGATRAVWQYVRYQDVYHKQSIRDMMLTAGPASDNPEIERGIAATARAVGVGPDDPINMHDYKTVMNYTRAAFKNEGATVDEAMLDRIVRRQLGMPNGAPVTVPPNAPSAPTGPALALPPNAGTADNPGGARPIVPAGPVDVGVRFDNAPPGTRTSVVQTGSGMNPAQVARNGGGV